MAITAVICEYNPFHLGHGRQLQWIRGRCPADAIVCLMSGLFVQRGQPAVFSPEVRARAALLSGADLVLELPVTVSLSSAEGFADGAVEILSRLGVDRLCFGAETRDPEALIQAARVLLSPAFPQRLREHLDTGVSFPRARALAAQALGADPSVLEKPNDTLAIEYAKAVLGRKIPMELLPMHRPGDYHAGTADPENPSATALRRLILAGRDWLSYVPEGTWPAYEGAVPHSLAFGETAVLGRLRSMSEEEFQALPYGSEGLWRKFMAESRRQRTLEDILTAVKSKRYTRSRLDRMALCAFLGLTDRDLQTPAAYVRILGANARGRALLASHRGDPFLARAGEKRKDPRQSREDQMGRLYGLFAPVPESPDRPRKTLIF